MKKIAVLSLTLIVLTLLIYHNFLQPEKIENNNFSTENPLENKVVFESITLDLSEENQIITYGELIALTGKAIFQWELSTNESNPWYENYVKAAVSKKIVTDNVITFESSLSLAEAIEFFVNVLEVTGENKYPTQYDFYENEVSKFMETNNESYSSFVKAMAHGILPLNINNTNFDRDLTKGQAYNIINTIEDKSLRNFQFLVSDEYKNILLIENQSYPVGVFFSGDSLIFNTELKNISSNNHNFWFGLSLQDPSGEWIDLPAKEISLTSNKSVDVTYQWEVLEEILSGNYHVVCSIWDKPPHETNSLRIAHMEAPKILSLYNYQENFNSLDTNRWKASTFTLGRTDFLPENVKTKEGKLIIDMPAKTFRSGEIQSTDFKSYGSYEIRMKLPDAKGSITGFFMYKAPDYYHEIDIEIYNDTSKEFFLTTYSDGKIQNEFLGELPFDVTSSYNNYRFDYYPDRLDYYINDIFIVSFNNGYSHDPMHLILNCWYPNWLENGPADEDVSLLVEWIRY